MSLFQQRYDVVIVGSGPGGSTLAYSLARHGCRILLLEEGDFLQPDPARAEVTAISMGELQRKGLRKYVGGSSKLYGAALYRMREIDFRATATETGESSAWPISYADLEPYYAQAERLYGVRGSPEGDPSEPPRSGPFPHGPIPHEPYIAEVVERIRAQGLPVAYIPKAVDHGPGGRCVLCATCDGYYCQRDAKLDAEVAVLRPALLTGRVQLLTRARCLKVLTTPDGRSATGILLEHEGARHEVHAGVVAVCAGVTQTPLILWRSRNGAHPQGIGNATGCLGRYLAGHTAGMLFPIRNLRKVPPLHQKTFAINAYYEPSADWPYPLGVIQAAGQFPLWESVPGFMRPFVKFIAQRSLMCFLMTEAVPSKDSGLRFDGDRIVGMRRPLRNMRTYRKLREHAVRIFKDAGYGWVYSPRTPVALWHPVGTARFGTDPATSVLDPDCRVHGMDNLYVADSCFLPSAGAVNTSLSVIAMALRVAATIARTPTVSSVPAA
ncbi:GMC oxidoreductase [Corallococcus carmarthensis]|uniref:GMC family oxidoreductase n=1 Tax=Corallococcus carmarthensis TaxID=2316728 RepID=A0A3A8L097_9BACT|nr:GMC family oxidoreductase [Corallococcus carmarthensis]NOK15623.1 GMC family oxidoreductase [Corallococcus carmarthensis]RKH07912.1 GMC family oxidoreductase [Corallococcus carmarthensis]